MSPSSPGDTTASMIAIALAEGGIAHTFATGKLRTSPAASGGPPEGPLALRVSRTRHGVARKKPLPHSPAAAIEMLLEPIAVQPLPLVTVTSSCTEPDDPATKLTAAACAPDVIVPLVIDQEYVSPPPADGTEALPEKFGQMDAGAEIAAEGSARTLAFVVATGEGQPLAVAVTRYWPDADVGAERI